MCEIMHGKAYEDLAASERSFLAHIRWDFPLSYCRNRQNSHNPRPQIIPNLNSRIPR